MRVMISVILIAYASEAITHKYEFDVVRFICMLMCCCSSFVMGLSEGKKKK